MPRDREQCLASGMDDYLSKPLKNNTLDEVLARWSPATLRPAPVQGPRPFDPTHLNELTECDEDLNQSLIETFLHQAPGLVALIREAIKANNKTALAQTAHRLKGSVLHLTLDGPSLTTARLEELGKRPGEDLREAEQIGALLEREMVTLIAQLREHQKGPGARRVAAR
jgi:HPt (histidine-containing phosphotransfer) domain-containing protein